MIQTRGNNLYLCVCKLQLGGGNEDWSAEFAGHASDSADEAGAESSSLRPSRRPGLRRNPPSKFKKVCLNLNLEELSAESRHLLLLRGMIWTTEY
jgi:hypothetical protein